MNMMDEVTKEVDKYIAIAEKAFSRKFPMPKIKINIRANNLNGQCAHNYVTNEVTLRFHPGLIDAYEDKYFSTTLPHEVAHAIVYYVYGRVARSHGREWVHVMSLFGVDANRCNSYDRSVVKPKYNRKEVAKYTYTCGCKGFSGTITAHRYARIKKGARYTCLDCRETIKVVA